MQLTCPNCQTEIPAENINIQKTLALCPECGAVFDFGEDRGNVAPKVKRRKAKKPDAVTLHDEADSLHLSYPLVNDRASKIAIGFLSIVLIGFIVMIGSQLISEGKTTALIFLSLIFGGLGAMFAGMLFMRSHLTFSNEQFANYWSPFALNRSELYSEEIIEFKYEEITATLESSMSAAKFNVYAILVGDRKRLVTGSIADENLAAYIAQELNQRLNEGRISESAVGNLRDDVADEAISEEPDWVEETVYMEDGTSKQQQ
ncbi:MAG: hypothetical protein CL607_17165 [Anaerolineaceae bacterium]|nr:hypothetical protein [Anaerolineaceae bacterium]